jgi:hypothetical protein
VSQSPDIFTLDIRPDGSAGEKRSFLTGFGGRNHDHGVHSVFLGPDGLLYGAFGNEGAHVTDRGGGKIATDGKPYFGGCVFRCNVDGTGLKILAHNFRNNYECALDAFGNIWQSDNDDDGNQWVRFTYVMTGGNYGFLGPTGRHGARRRNPISTWRIRESSRRSCARGRDPLPASASTKVTSCRRSIAGCRSTRTRVRGWCSASAPSRWGPGGRSKERPSTRTDGRPSRRSARS